MIQTCLAGETVVYRKMSGRVRTRVDRGTGEVVAYSDAAVRNNLAVIEYCRTSMAALSGATAGLYMNDMIIDLNQLSPHLVNCLLVFAFP